MSRSTLNRPGSPHLLIHQFPARPLSFVCTKAFIFGDCYTTASTPSIAQNFTSPAIDSGALQQCRHPLLSDQILVLPHKPRHVQHGEGAISRVRYTNLLWDTRRHRQRLAPSLIQSTLYARRKALAHQAVWPASCSNGTPPRFPQTNISLLPCTTLCRA